MKKWLVAFELLLAVSALPGQTVRITAPNEEGERLVLGTPYTIRWTSSGVSGDIRLVLFDGDRRVDAITTGILATRGEYLWTAGSHAGGVAPEGSNYRVRIVVAGGDGIDDYSDHPFRLVSSTTGGGDVDAAITVDRPRSGDVFTIGQTTEIQWTSPAAESGVDIGNTVALSAIHLPDQREFMIRNFRDNRPGANSYRWFIEPPVFHDFAGDFRIRVVSSSGLRAESPVFRLESTGDEGGSHPPRRDDPKERDLAIRNPDVHLTQVSTQMDLPTYRVRVEVEVSNLSRTPAGGPQAPLADVILQMTLQYSDSPGLWHSTPYVGRTNAGPVLSLEWAEREAAIDFLTFRAGPEDRRFRFQVEIDPDRTLSDPDRDNNQLSTNTFGRPAVVD